MQNSDDRLAADFAHRRAALLLARETKVREMVKVSLEAVDGVEGAAERSRILMDEELMLSKALHELDPSWDATAKHEPPTKRQ